MKRINKLGSIVLLMVAVLFSTSCSDQFLQDKKNYGSFGEEIYDTYIGAKLRVNTLYNFLLPSSTGSIGWNSVSAGTGDINAKSTEEYGGLSDYVNPSVSLDNTNVPDYIFQEFGSTNNKSPYGHIRECNMVIEGITNSELPQEQKEELLGQALFFRAWIYFRLVRIYGGVPIVDKAQNPIVGEDDGIGLVVPRSTTKECIDFICDDLELAAGYLPASWSKPTEDFGRVTSGTALALQGRARLLYASPLFNRSDEKTRWNLAYESNKAAIAKLKEGGFGLANLSNPGMNASGWAQMFSTVYPNPEAVFVTLYNNVKEGTGTNYNKNNGWENSIRPVNADGGGGKATTAQMVDLFPMADGKKPGDATSKYYPYNPDLFFLNRDPRFYRTFAFPGVEWKFDGTPANYSEHPEQYPYLGDNYVLWSYSWYEKKENQTADDQSGYGADGLGDNNKSVYVRKRSDDVAINSPLYTYYGETKKAFQYSGAPYIEMRYAEVLLNFAEAACGAEHYDEAIQALQDIRKRVGYTDANNYGLEAGLVGDRAKLFAAILYERQIELAYEGKRFDDMRRWMLWDGGTGQEQLKATWKLTGFGGNTCTYLGVKPLNGTRRTGIEIRVADKIGTASEKDGEDPLVKYLTENNLKRPIALNLMKDMTIQKEHETDADKTIDKLADFYREYLIRKTTRVDGDLEYNISFKPEYYFIGFKSNMQANNVTLKQTIGWKDSQNGGAVGTYDPLAE